MSHPLSQNGGAAGDFGQKQNGVSNCKIKYLSQIATSFNHHTWKKICTLLLDCAKTGKVLWYQL